MKHLFFIVLLVLAFLVFSLWVSLMLVKVPKPDNITWGVDFSQMQAEALKLDWKKVYLAVLEDLGARHIKLHTQWDWVEGERGKFYFGDIDWQIEQSRQHDVNIIYVVGMKTGRWPECHAPAWSSQVSKEVQQKELLNYIATTVERYKGNTSIIAWQAENEPLFQFGECPWYDKDFLVKEVALIKALDPSRPVIISDSGEQSMWFDAARIGDVVGTTMYRKVWIHISDSIGFYFNFPIPPITYWLKARIIEGLLHKKVINVELQAEPWASQVFYNVPLEEQEKSMSLAQFTSNIKYAKAAGFDAYYFWGVEWWYWLKFTQNKPEIWNEAKKIFYET